MTPTFPNDYKSCRRLGLSFIREYRHLIKRWPTSCPFWHSRIKREQRLLAALRRGGVVAWRDQIVLEWEQDQQQPIGDR